MFGGLIDDLDSSKWEEQNACDRTGDYKEYNVLRYKMEEGATTGHYLVSLSSDESAIPITVELLDVKPKHNPLKNIGIIELKLDAEQKCVLGIDLNGDIVVRKC